MSLCINRSRTGAGQLVLAQGYAGRKAWFSRPEKSKQNRKLQLFCSCDAKSNKAGQ